MNTSETIDALAGANLSRTISTLNGLTCGKHQIIIRSSAEFNEITIRLYDDTISKRTPIATAYIDRGHTAEEKYAAAEEVRGTARAFLTLAVANIQVDDAEIKERYTCKYCGKTTCTEQADQEPPADYCHHEEE